MDHPYTLEQTLEAFRNIPPTMEDNKITKSYIFRVKKKRHTVCYNSLNEQDKDDAFQKACEGFNTSMNNGTSYPFKEISCLDRFFIRIYKYKLYDTWKGNPPNEALDKIKETEGSKPHDLEAYYKKLNNLKIFLLTLKSVKTKNSDEGKISSNEKVNIFTLKISGYSYKEIKKELEDRNEKINVSVGQLRTIFYRMNVELNALPSSAEQIEDMLS